MEILNDEERAEVIRLACIAKPSVNGGEELCQAEQKNTQRQMIEWIENEISMTTVDGGIFISGTIAGAKWKEFKARLDKPDVCPECKGKGELVNSSGIPSKYETCPTCKGTGRKPN